MFGVRGGSASHGSPAAFNLAGVPMGVPQPSGGLGNVSVNNKSLDLVTNDVPSVLVQPSSHSQISLDNDENRLSLNDFVFVLNNETKYAPDYSGPYKRLGANEVPLVSIPQLNRLLFDCAVGEYQRCSEADPATHFQQLSAINEAEPGLDRKGHWWASPQLVAQWASPYGAVLNLMQMGNWGGGGSKPSRTRQAVNVVVSRRAQVKNNFYAASAGQGKHAQSSMPVGVQYSVEMMKPVSTSNDTIPVVVVSMILINDTVIASRLSPMSRQEARDLPLSLDAERKYNERKHWERNPEDEDNQVAAAEARDPKQKLITIRADAKGNLTANEDGFKAFEAKPLRGGSRQARVVVPIGRVLHSPPRGAAGFEALYSCLSKVAYDRLMPIEIELGAP